MSKNARGQSGGILDHGVASPILSAITSDHIIFLTYEVDLAGIEPATLPTGKSLVCPTLPQLQGQW